MSTDMIGMDPDEVRQLANNMRTQANQIGSIINSVESVVNQLINEWQGPDAAEFQGWWTLQHKPALVAVETAITGLAQSADNRARQQDEASAANGSAGGPLTLPNAVGLSPDDAMSVGLGTLVGGAGLAASGGSGSGTGAASTAAADLPGNATVSQWASATLSELGVPDTASNQQFLETWAGREGGNWNNTATYNPLNTETQVPGSENYLTGVPGYSVAAGANGVQAYSSWQTGVQATVETLNNGDYPDILNALKAGDAMSVNNSGGLAANLLTWSGNGYSQV